MNHHYIDEIEMGYLMNYDGDDREDFKFKDLFSKKGRQEIIDDIKDKHPKLKAALDKHPALEKMAKAALAYEAAMIGVAGATLATAGAYYAGTSFATGGSLAAMKPAMTAVLKSNGQKTNGLPLKDIVKNFLKLKGEESLGANSDFPKIAEYFGKIKDKVNAGKASDADKLLSDLIDGAAKNIIDKGSDFVSKAISGDDAANDTPLATPTPEPIKKDATTDTNKPVNMTLILGALVLVFLLAKK